MKTLSPNSDVGIVLLSVVLLGSKTHQFVPFISSRGQSFTIAKRTDLLVQS